MEGPTAQPPLAGVVETMGSRSSSKPTQRLVLGQEIVLRACGPTVVSVQPPAAGFVVTATTPGVV